MITLLELEVEHLPCRGVYAVSLLAVADDVSVHVALEVEHARVVLTHGGVAHLALSHATLGDYGHQQIREVDYEAQRQGNQQVYTDICVKSLHTV